MKDISNNLIQMKNYQLKEIMQISSKTNLKIKQGTVDRYQFDKCNNLIIYLPLVSSWAQKPITKK